MAVTIFSKDIVRGRFEYIQKLSMAICAVEAKGDQESLRDELLGIIVDRESERFTTFLNSASTGDNKTLIKKPVKKSTNLRDKALNTMIVDRVDQFEAFTSNTENPLHDNFNLSSELILPPELIDKGVWVRPGDCDLLRGERPLKERNKNNDIIEKEYREIRDSFDFGVSFFTKWNERFSDWPNSLPSAASQNAASPLTIDNAATITCFPDAEVVIDQFLKKGTESVPKKKTLIETKKPNRKRKTSSRSKTKSKVKSKK